MGVWKASNCAILINLKDDQIDHPLLTNLVVDGIWGQFSRMELNRAYKTHYAKIAN